MRLTPVGKIVALIVVIGVAIGIYRMTGGKGGDLLGKLAPEKKTAESTVPPQAQLPSSVDAPEPEPGAVKPASFTPAGKEPGCADKPEVRFLVWAWNSQMGLMAANGGPQATKGSLMCRKGVNLKLIRQDDPAKMQEELVAFATELSRGNDQPAKGAHFVAIMGDGSATFLKGVNDTLRKLGSDYTAKIVGSCGYSRGEDKFMGPPEWKENPQAARGGVVSGYLRDGDWNIALKWLGDNGLKNNPDEKTYDPDALNWVAANDYIDAGEKYISGYSETRQVVKNGKKTGQTKKVTVNGVVTWTPGDVNVAQKKGGLVSIVSTKEYSAQMPNVIIGIDKWMRANRSTVENMLQAIVEGGDQVRSNPSALDYAAEVSAEVYHEEDPAYWKKYYKGVVEKDKQGLDVELGGSKVNNLADNLLLFGLVPGSQNLLAATYKVFGDIVVNQYPDLVKSYDPIDRVLDTSYVQNLAKKAGGATSIVKTTPPGPKLASAAANRAPVKRTISRKAWRITFATGRAEFTPSAQAQLQQLLRDTLVAGGASIDIHGHTDSQGSADSNMQLSEARAFAVKSWLEKKAPVNFPAGRIRVFAHGQTNPIAPNSNEAGRAQNRRVEIVLGT